MGQVGDWQGGRVRSGCASGQFPGRFRFVSGLFAAQIRAGVRVGCLCRIELGSSRDLRRNGTYGPYS
ncbi:hypothetical protein ACTNDP_07370 [Paenibacillus barengoltzii]|uniref:hypothetical protein n=1 Tax=Paenibacillus barengoltzii TaxID=343517 RepID=UPI003F886C4D